MIANPNPVVLCAVSLLALGPVIFQACSDPSESTPVSGSGVLQLVRESKLSKLLPDQGNEWEASGVHARSGFLYVVFDNMTSIGIVNVSLSEGSLAPGGELKNSQYEGITYDDHGTPHFYVVKETDGDTVFRGRIIQLDDNLANSSSEDTDAIFDDPNTGLEGIAWLWAHEADYLLALCEANGCGNGDTSAGHGRVKVLKQDDDMWITKAILEIPSSAGFLDYSDIALRDRGDGTASVAIVSQRSSAMWLGTVAQDPWRFADSGAVYEFPKTAGGSVQYCDVEGVTFLDDKTFAMVSDKTSGGDACRNKDESVHVFKLP